MAGFQLPSLPGMLLFVLEIIPLTFWKISSLLALMIYGQSVSRNYSVIVFQLYPDVQIIALFLTIRQMPDKRHLPYYLCLPSGAVKQELVQLSWFG